MTTAAEIRQHLEETPPGGRLFLRLHSGEIVSGSSTWLLDGDDVVLYSDGRPRTIGLDLVAAVGQIVSTPLAAAA